MANVKNTYHINGHTVFDYRRNVCDNLSKGLYPFYNPVCICGERISSAQVNDKLKKGTINDHTDRYYCVKHNKTNRGHGREKYVTIYVGNKIVWKSNERLSRDSTYKAIEGLTLRPCNNCGKDYCHGLIVYKSNHKDHGYYRDIFLDEEYYCQECIASNVPHTNIIYKGKIHRYRCARDKLSKVVYDEGYIICRNCNKNKVYPSRLLESHNSSDWKYLEDGTKQFNFDKCLDWLCYCEDCYSEYYFNMKSKVASQNTLTIHWLERNINFRNLDKLTEQEEINEIKNLDLFKEFVKYNIYPILYFSYAEKIGISNEYCGRHHLLPKSVFPIFENYRVNCTIEEHYKLHYLLFLDILNSINDDNDEHYLVKAKLMSGLLMMYKSKDAKHSEGYTEYIKSLLHELFNDSFFK